MSNGHHSSCDGCVRCQEDTCPEVAYCVNEWPILRPCPHNEPYCGDHNLENCAACREEAEREMFRSGTYSAEVDPFVLPEKTAEAEAYWAAGPREVSPGIFRYPEGDAS